MECKNIYVLHVNKYRLNGALNRDAFSCGEHFLREQGSEMKRDWFVDMCLGFKGVQLVKMQGLLYK